jgi:peroxiredoxin
VLIHALKPMLDQKKNNKKNMKNIVHLLLVLCLVLIFKNTSGQTSPAGGSLIIKGKVAGLTQGSVSVTTEVFSQKKTFDAPIVMGKFEVKITQPSPTLYSLMVKGDPSMTISGMPAGRLLFFADNGIIQIEADQNDIANATVSGSLSHKEFRQYNSMVEAYDQKLENIKVVYANLDEAGELLPKKDSLEYLFNATYQKKDSSIQSWVRLHTKSFVSPLVMILNYADNGEPAIMRPMFDGFSAEVKKSYYGNFLEGVLDRKEGLSIGKAAPMFSQADEQGKPVSLSSFKGKYVLVDFWASWCGPCRQENPNLVRTYEKFKSKNFEILGVSLDNNKDKWLKAIQEDQLNWPHVSDLKYWKNEVAVQYGVQSIPANFLLDKEGKIIAKGLRGPALEKTLEHLLK